MKQQDYEILIEQLRAMCEGQRYMYTLLSNTSALLKQSLQDTNWVGYYLMQDGKLVKNKAELKHQPFDVRFADGIIKAIERDANE